MNARRAMISAVITTEKCSNYIVAEIVTMKTTKPLQSKNSHTNVAEHAHEVSTVKQQFIVVDVSCLCAVRTIGIMTTISSVISAVEIDQSRSDYNKLISELCISKL
uniref:(northern house mosquito) hypothetical protein n=1 Tax=Culex pipiens TaxID=7175 RepID=A0A8D8FWQ9_CULPI